MNILIATDLYYPQVNGVVTSVLNLREELLKMGHDVKVLTLSSNGKSYIEEDVRYVKSFPLKIYPDVRASLSIEDCVIDQLVEWEPDIIHTQCEFFTLIFAKIVAKKARCPIVHTYHTMYEHYVKYAIKYEYLGNKLLFSYMRNVMKKLEVIIAPTKKVEKSLREHDMDNKIVIIPTGIDLSKFNVEVPKSDIEALKESLSIGSDKKIVLTLGRIAKEKNIDEIIVNLKEIFSRRDDFVFIIVGDGPYKRELEKKVKVLKLSKFVRFTGMISPEDINKYYEMADCFVSASQSETQGLTYIEAMAKGLPEVCKYDSCLDEILIENYNGYYFQDQSEFAEHLENILDNKGLRQKLSDNARLTSKKFSKEVFAKNVSIIYEDIVDNYMYRSKYRGPKEIFNYLRKIY